MHPVEPSTMVRGPAALTMSFMTRADSQPWHVRWPEVKYSSRVTRLTPLKGSRIWVALVNVSAIGGLLSLALSTIRSRPAGARLFPDAEPVGLGVRLPGLRGSVAH